MGSLHHCHVSMHPGMDIALHRNGNLFSRPGDVKRLRSRRLRLVPLMIPAAWFRHGMDVVRSLIAVRDFEMLVDVECHHMRDILTSLLVPILVAGSCGTCRRSAQPFG